MQHDAKGGRESAQHTPGPWKQGGEWPELVAIYDANCVFIAHAETGLHGDWIDGKNPLGKDRAIANAKLIAAAPDMADALDAIRRLGGNLPDERLTDRTGANDAAHRGLMYTEARRIAAEALQKAGRP